MKPRLMAISGSLRGTVRPLVDGQMSIGREDSNTSAFDGSCSLAETLHDRTVDERYELADLDSQTVPSSTGFPYGAKPWATETPFVSATLSLYSCCTKETMLKASESAPERRAFHLRTGDHSA